MTTPVLMDARREWPNTGIGTLIREWRQFGQAEGGVGFLDDFAFPHRSPSPAEARALPGAMRRHGASLFHATYPYMVVSRRVPTALSLHDTLQLSYGRGRAAAAGALIRHNVRASVAVLALSESAKRDICERLRVPEDDVLVTPLGVRASPAAPARDPSPDAHLLYVGNDKPHKHLDQLARWGGEAAIRLGTRLVMVVPSDSIGRLAAISTGQPVELRSGIDEAELDRLRAGALAYVSLARGEGFGLPPLEAAAHGVPSVLLDAGAHREVMGPAAVYCELDRDSFVAAADELLARLPELRASAWTRAGEYPWERSWASVKRAYDTLI